ncbi:MAG: acetyl-CoA carboxylase carboxyl transferase subunit alpha, partial [Pirellulaceae bacterium]
METPAPGLGFEQPIVDLENRLHELLQGYDDSPEREDEIRELRRELAKVMKEVYDNLSPWQTVQVARHKERPHTTDYLGLVFDEFIELHGDRMFGDDRAIVTGFAKL